MARRSRGKTEGYIGKRPDGRWEVKLNLGWVNGKRRKCFYAKTRADVAKKLNDAISKHGAGAPISSDRLTVAQFMQQWCDAIKPPNTDIRPRTHENYVSINRLHVEPAIGRIKLSKLDPQTIQAMLAGKLAGAHRESRQLVRLRHLRRQNEEAVEMYLRRIGRKSPEKARQLRADLAKPARLSAVSIRHIRTVLRTALNTAVKWKLIAYNPATLLDRPPKVDGHEIQPLTADEARKLLEAAKGHRLEALFVLAIRLGLRRGELLGLRWCGVCFEDRKLNVLQAIQRITGKPLKAVELKTDKSKRNIALPEEVLRALRAHRARQAEERLVQGSGWHDMDLVFPNTIGKPQEPRAVDTMFKRLLKRAELPETTRLHDCRHTAATLLLERDAEMFQVSRLLGHASTAITSDIYSHITEKMNRGLAEKMDAIAEA